MNAVLASPEYLPPADSTAIHVAIIYEEFLSGARAKHFAEQLAEGLGSTCPLAESMWRSDMLECPSIATLAAGAAADCDYLILSLRGDRVLPPATRGWIEARLDGAAGHLACVIALLGSDDGKSRVLDGNRQYLRAMCAANRVVFFSHAGISPAESAATDFSMRRGMPAVLDD